VITKNGKVYVKGVLLAETEYSEDPKAPVRDSDIPAIIAGQTEKTAAVIELNDVQQGREHLIRKVEQHLDKGIQLIVIDAQEKEDLDIIASGITALKEKIIFAGSTGLAEYLPAYLLAEKAGQSNVVIAGSVSEETRRQIEYASKNSDLTIIDVETEKLFSGERSKERDRIINIIKGSSQKGKNMVIRTAGSRAAVEMSIKHGQQYGLDMFMVSETIASFLGEIARFIVEEIKIKGILLTGGDTAIKAARELKVTGTIIKDEVIPGVPYGCFAGGEFKEIIVLSLVIILIVLSKNLEISNPTNNWRERVKYLRIYRWKIIFQYNLNLGVLLCQKNGRISLKQNQKQKKIY